jgi:hypothetical protein
MTPREVAGLNAIAKAHGGSLTTNPDTGLPEAGFLSSILPMIAGGLLAATGIGAPMAAALVGGGTTIATGSLKKGLMAGLGAFGGAGIGQGLAASAATTAAPTTVTAAQTAAETAANAVTPLAPQPAMIPDPSGMAQAMAPTNQSVLNAITPPGATPPITTTGMMPNPTALTPEAAQIGDVYAKEQAAQNAFAKTMAEGAGKNSLSTGISNLGTEAGRNAFMGKAAVGEAAATGVGGGSGLLKYGTAALAPVAAEYMEPKPIEEKKYDPIDYDFSYNQVEDPNAGYTGAYTGERTYFNPTFTERPKMAAGGGLMDIQAKRYAEGGTSAVKPVEQNPYYTMSGQSGDMFKYLMGQQPARVPAPAAAPVAAPTAPAAAPVLKGSRTPNLSKGTPTYTFDPVTGTFSQPTYVKNDVDEGNSAVSNTTTFEGAANGGLMALAQGGASHLGDYSDGGRLLRGPGDGVSDSIPASIGDKRPARLADGEFVVPARIVSELGNGSTEAGARKLYAMMDRVQRARSKTVGKGRVAVNSRAEKMLPV